MTRDTNAGQTAPAVPNPDHDRHAAGVYQCIALRFYNRYADARRSAEFRGSDIEGAEPLVAELEASERYQEAVAEWVFQPADTIDAALALTEFVGVVAADKLMGEALREGGPVSDEKDALHQVVAISAIGEWLNVLSQREWLDRREAAYGPGGMSPQEKGG